MDRQAVEAQLCELPISQYAWIDPRQIEFSERIRYVCEHECTMYGKSWACPPAVGTVEACRKKVLSYPAGLVFTPLTEVEDIADRSRPARRMKKSRGRCAISCGSIPPTC